MVFSALADTPVLVTRRWNRPEECFQFVGSCLDGGYCQDSRGENTTYAELHNARGYSSGTPSSPAPRFAPSEPSRPVSSPRNKHMRGYVQFRYLFLGIIMGSVRAALFWIIVGLFTGVSGVGWGV